MPLMILKSFILGCSLVPDSAFARSHLLSCLSKMMYLNDYRILVGEEGHLALPAKNVKLNRSSFPTDRKTEQITYLKKAFFDEAPMTMFSIAEWARNSVIAFGISEASSVTSWHLIWGNNLMCKNKKKYSLIKVSSEYPRLFANKSNEREGTNLWFDCRAVVCT